VFAGARPSGAGKHRVNRKPLSQREEPRPRSETAAPAASFNKALHLSVGRLRRPPAGERQSARETLGAGNTPLQTERHTPEQKRGTPMSTVADDRTQAFKDALEKLANLYAEAERRTFSLPTFSLSPAGTFFWASVKFAILLELDLLLIIPMNLVVTFRNVFPGRWAYRAFSVKYWRCISRWVWNGEIPLPANIVVRSLTSALLGWHFHRRFAALKRRIILDTLVDTAGRERVIAEVDRLLAQWPAPRLVQSLFTYGLPLLSPLAGLYQVLIPKAPAIWTRLVALLFLGYGLGLVASAFVVKRGVMLGAKGRMAYFPGFVEGSGAYAVEREILTTFALSEREFPLAFALTLLFIPIQLLQAIYMYDSGVYAVLTWGVGFRKGAYVAESMIGVAVVVLIDLIALARRRKLGRF